MSVVILLACVLLLVGHGACFKAWGNQGCALGKTHDGKPESCENIKCTDYLPKTCKDVINKEKRTMVTLADGFVVVCDTETDGGGWIVFQRRFSADVDFYRNWTDYKYGFGFTGSNFWLGNENIHHLTFQRPHQLRVDFTYAGSSYFAVYSKFRVFGEAEKYKLEVAGYSGNASDVLSHQSGHAFTTADRDNDVLAVENCAKIYHGAWWYSSCHSSNLNGKWGSKNYGVGLSWGLTTGFIDSATSTEMKIRPLD